MKIYRCLIADDNETDTQQLADFLAKLSFFGEPTICVSSTEALSALLQNSYDLVFISTELQGSNGLELISSARLQCPHAIIVSSEATHAVDCFDLDVADFLLKPITKPRLLRSLQRAIGIKIDHEYIVASKVIFLKVGRRLQKFSYDQIDYIEAYGIYSKIYQKGKVELVNEPITALESRLPVQLFRRVHKSYIVNLDHTTSYNQNNFFIGETKIPIGVSYRDHVPNIYQLLG